MNDGEINLMMYLKLKLNTIDNKIEQYHLWCLKHYKRQQENQYTIQISYTQVLSK